MKGKGREAARNALSESGAELASEIWGDKRAKLKK
jgi:hypothetical protein